MEKQVGKCVYCNDPIYDFQEMLVVKGKKFHIGCYVITVPDGLIVLRPREISVGDDYGR